LLVIIHTDPVEYIVSANLHRRHLTAEQKRDLIDHLLRATPEKSDLQIAKQVKASPHTVGKRRAKLEAAGDVCNVQTRTDTKGRKQPASKQKSTKPKPEPKVVAAPSVAPAQPEPPSGSGFAERRMFGGAVRSLVTLRGQSIAKLIDECSRTELRAAMDFLADIERAKQKAEATPTAEITTTTTIAPADDGLDIPACLDRRPKAAAH
jgi:hypothetical protein